MAAILFRPQCADAVMRSGGVPPADHTLKPRRRCQSIYSSHQTTPSFNDLLTDGFGHNG